MNEYASTITKYLPLSVHLDVLQQKTYKHLWKAYSGPSSGQYIWICVRVDVRCMYKHLQKLYLDQEQ